MQKNDAVRRSDTPKNLGLPTVLFGAAFAAACGGPATVLHDVLDEAETRVDFALETFEDTADEMNEAIATELPPCPAAYEPPVLSEPPPYRDVVERPADLPDSAEENDVLYRHRIACRDSGTALRNLTSIRDEALPPLEDFSEYVDALRDFIDDDMTDEDIESLSAEVDAVARARTDEDDTLQLRYQRLHSRVVELSPLLSEMALVVRRPGARVAPGRLPDPEAREDLAALAEPWTGIIENHAEARAFFEVWNDYRRRIYEGPDAEDPDKAAAGWNPPTGVWTGEYVQLGREYVGRYVVRITFEADGRVVSRYPESNCGGPLELISTSGAFGRVTRYSDTGCTRPATVTLERTGEDRMRFQYGRTHAGNLTRE